jgi:twitching motility protein PilT
MLDASAGLLIVTGAAGSGKTALLGALTDHVNASTHALVVTIDALIEVVHPRKQGVVSQLQVGTHCNSFEHGIRSAVAMDADVIVVSELDAPGALPAALQACAGGTLVLGGVRAWGAGWALERLLASVGLDARPRTRLALAEACVGIVVQELAAKRAAQETFVRSPGLSNAIRDGKVATLTGIRTGG